MSQSGFKKQAQVLFKNHEKLLARRNKKLPGGNGIYDRYEFPVLTAAHAPISGATISTAKPIRCFSSAWASMPHSTPASAP